VGLSLVSGRTAVMCRHRANKYGGSRRHAQTVVIYDGDCGICGYVIAKLSLRLGAHPDIVFASFRLLSDHDFLELGITRGTCSAALQVVTLNNDIMSGAFAFAWLLSQGYPRVSRLLSLLLRIPWFARAAVATYSVFAANRLRISAMLGMRSCKP
jgi:predicted DCC family thiol-disulfide oxidoreductase YuxK